jgi:hypothetical protein
MSDLVSTDAETTIFMVLRIDEILQRAIPLCLKRDLYTCKQVYISHVRQDADAYRAVAHRRVELFRSGMVDWARMPTR